MGLVLSVLGDYKPKSAREIVRATGLSWASVYCCLSRCWKRGLILRTEKLIYESERVFRGKGGLSRNTRPYHLYVLGPEGFDSLVIDGRRFAKYKKEYLDVRGVRTGCFVGFGTLHARVPYRRKRLDNGLDVSFALAAKNLNRGAWSPLLFTH